MSVENSFASRLNKIRIPRISINNGPGKIDEHDEHGDEDSFAGGEHGGEFDEHDYDYDYSGDFEHDYLDDESGDGGYSISASWLGNGNKIEDSTENFDDDYYGDESEDGDGFNDVAEDELVVENGVLPRGNAHSNNEDDVDGAVGVDEVISVSIGSRENVAASEYHEFDEDEIGVEDGEEEFLNGNAGEDAHEFGNEHGIVSFDAGNDNRSGESFAHEESVFSFAGDDENKDLHDVDNFLADFLADDDEVEFFSKPAGSGKIMDGSEKSSARISFKKGGAAGREYSVQGRPKGLAAERRVSGDGSIAPAVDDAPPAKTVPLVSRPFSKAVKDASMGSKGVSASVVKEEIREREAEEASVRRIVRERAKAKASVLDAIEVVDKNVKPMWESKLEEGESDKIVKGGKSKSSVSKPSDEVVVLVDATSSGGAHVEKADNFSEDDLDYAGRGDGRLSAKQLSSFRSLVDYRALGSAFAFGGGGATAREDAKKKALMDLSLSSLSASGGKHGKFSWKDAEALEFLVKFRYGRDVEVGRLFGEVPATGARRLRKLRDLGFVVERKVVGSKPLWMPTREGMEFLGLDLPLDYSKGDDKLSLNQAPHNLVVNLVASGLWRGALNVLWFGENVPPYDAFAKDVWPPRNRFDARGLPSPGDFLVSQREIESAWGKFRGLNNRRDVYRKNFRNAWDEEFRQWVKRKDPTIRSPELLEGNEHFWVLIPLEGGKAFHHFDLVVKRARGPRGEPKSIGVEIERTAKTSEEYVKILRAMKLDLDRRDTVYERVVWICSSPTIEGLVRRAAAEVEFSKKKLAVLPIVDEEGIVRRRNLWEL